MAHAGFESKTRTTRNYVMRHRKLGLCPHCNNKVEKGKTKCSKHLKYQREWLRKQRNKT